MHRVSTLMSGCSGLEIKNDVDNSKRTVTYNNAPTHKKPVQYGPDVLKYKLNHETNFPAGMTCYQHLLLSQAL